MADENGKVEISRANYRFILALASLAIPTLIVVMFMVFEYLSGAAFEAEHIGLISGIAMATLALGSAAFGYYFGSMENKQ